MWPFSLTQQYEKVTGEDDEQPIAAQHPVRRLQWPIYVALGCVALLLLFVFAVFASTAPSSNEKEAAPSQHDPVEKRCTTRREWRTLSDAEQQNYISAVQCLRHQPSVLTAATDHTAYDDFPWIHSHVGYFTHNSAPFLPWHRYFLHIYETTLREKCGYEGALVFWDWTLDAGALEKSPIFDPFSGFGGDGQQDGSITVGRSGRCIVDGPFANVNVSFYDVEFKPHCLSRGFRDRQGNLGHIDGHDISPESIDEVLGLEKYEDFVALMESRVHDAIPFGIGGDFETFTAPYDPIFFLHHTQLDRLWWLWQQKNDGANINAYGGHKQRHSIEMASLDDEIDMRGLAPSIKVSEVMDTANDLLCYQY